MATEPKKILINQIYLKDIVSMIGETHTSKDFNKLIIAGIKTKEGKVYDLLFDERGELIKPREQAETVNRLAIFFEKDLRIMFFDNVPCLAHCYN